jgi:hypothetical protein
LKNAVIYRCSGHRFGDRCTIESVFGDHPVDECRPGLFDGGRIDTDVLRGSRLRQNRYTEENR